MKKPFKLPPPDSSDLIFDMTPMIDMVFQLLIFFLLTFTFSEQVMDITLPKAENIRVKEEEELINLNIKKSGEIIIKDQSVTLEKMEALLLEIKNTPGKKLIVVQADAGIFFERFVQVIDKVKGLGLTDIAIVAERDER